MGAALLLLIRHAHVDATRDGEPLLCGRHNQHLSDWGRREVQLLRDELESEVQAAAAYSSTLHRAVETAAAAPRRLHSSLRRMLSLSEIDCGELDGWPLSRIRKQFPEIWRRNCRQADEDFCWPGGETYARFRRRVLRGIWAIARAHPGERVLIFTHAGVVNQVVGSIVKQSAARWENYRPGNAAITEICCAGEGGLELISFNRREHLVETSIHRPAV